MANGSFESSTGTNFEIGVEWSSTPNTEKNSSRVSVNVYLSHYTISCVALQGSYVRIGSNTYNFTKSMSSSVNSKQKTYIASYSADIAHGADGTKSVEIAAGYVFRGTYSGVYIDTLSVSRTVTLDKIPRASELSAPSSLTVGSASKFTVTSHLSSYRHKLEFKVGSASYTTPYLTSLSQSVSVPASLAGGIVSSSSAAGAVILHTYTSSGAAVGQRSYSVRYNVPKSADFMPTFTLSAKPSSASSLITAKGIYAAGITKAVISVTGAAAKYGGSISKCQLSCGAVKQSGYTMTSQSLSKGALTIGATVTDSRGISSTKTMTLQVLPYSFPYASVTDIYRCGEAGDPDDRGEYIYVSASLAVSGLGGANGGRMSVSYKRHTSSSYSTEYEVISGLPMILDAALLGEASYDVRLVCRDDVGNETVHKLFIPTANVDFHLYNGKARFGGYCEKDGFECDWDANFGGKVMIDGSPIGDFVVESGYEGIWHWRKWNSGFSECFGTTPQKTYEVTYSWGALYHTEINDAASGNSETYPTGLFTDIPAVQATPYRYGQAVMLMPKSSGSSTASPDYYIVSATNGTYTASINLHCTGMWK